MGMAMRIAIVGWAFFGLTLVSLLGYVLNRGVFVGADVELQIFGGPPWPKYCYYLHLRGISQETAKAANDAEAQATSCPFLKSST
jgi:hypothetical protein